MLQSIFLFCQFVSEIPAGILGDIFRKKTIILMGLVTLMATPLITFSAMYSSKGWGLAILISSFALEGIGNALLSGADDALFYEAMRFEGKDNVYGKVRGQVQLVSAIAVGVATFVGGGFYSIHPFLPYIAQAFMLLFSTIIIFTMKEERIRAVDDQKQSKAIRFLQSLSVFKEMIHSSNILFMFFFTAMIASTVNAIFALLPDYITELGFSSSENGAIFMVYSYIGGIVATQAYRLSKLNHKPLISVILGILVIGTVLQIQSNNLLFLIGMGLLYVIVDILDPIIMQMLNLWVKDESRVTFISGLSFSISLLTMISNLIISSVIVRYGMVKMVAMTSCFTIFMVIISYYLIFKGTQKSSNIRNFILRRRK